MTQAADLHCDTAGLIQKGYSLGRRHRRHHIDLPRMQDGDMGLQVFANFVKPHFWRKRYYPTAMRMLRSLQRELDLYPSQIRPCLGKEDLLCSPGRVLALFGIEGGHHLDGSIARILELFESGVRIFTLTWNNSNFLGSSCKDPCHKTKGLTDMGRSAVRTMNRLGMAVDLSHAGERTFWDALEVAGKPPFASHSCAKSLRDTPRNISDDQVRALAKAGGIVGVCFYRKFLRNGFWPLADVGDLCRHVLRLCEVGGPDCVALGGDFDGMGLPARGIPDVSFLPVLSRELSRRGLDEGTIRKLFLENALNYFRRVLP